MKIAILTNFLEMNPGYSLTGIVEDQIRILARQGHEVHFFVRENFKRGDTQAPIFEERFQFHAAFPDFPQTDYMKLADVSTADWQNAVNLADVMVEELAGFDVALTHDFLLTGWNLPYQLAVRKASGRLPNLAWLHWIHSIPSGMRDYWDIRPFRPNHKLIFPNGTDALRVVEQFQGELEDIRVIPHCKDLRSFADFHPDTIRFIDQHPGVMRADVVQILPAGQDRLKWKRVPEVIEIFGAFKHLNLSVCLVVANQWASQTTYRQNMDEYKALAEAAGLEPGREFIFTSDFEHPRFETGLPRRMIRELMQCANLFVFPTHHESFGLVVPEAALAGNFMVLNGDLTMQHEVCPFAQFHGFGSFEHEREFQDRDGWLHQVALIILGRMRQNESIMARTHARQAYNWDALYERFYGPILAESRLWIEKRRQAA